MPKYNNDSFRDMTIKEKFATVVGITLLIILVLVFVLGLYFFGMAGIFELLGVQYKSIWSLAVFVVSFFILGIIIESFSKAIFKLTVKNITGKMNIFIIRFSFEVLSNWLILFTVDEFMNSITLSTRTEIVIAIVIAVLEITFDNDKEKLE